MKIRLGIVGIGRSWERRHAPALRALCERFEVRAVCDPIGHRARQAAEQFGATPVDGVRALVNREDLDAVMLLSSKWYGEIPILAACEAGKAIYCGSTIDLESDQAVRVRKQVRDAGIAFMAEFPHRVAPATIRLKELIATRLGRPKMLFAYQRKTVDAAHSRQQAWVMRQMIEMVDWCRDLVGRPPTSVVGTSDGCDGQDFLRISLGFAATQHHPEKPTAEISCRQYLPGKWSEAASFRAPANLEVVCEHGIAFVDLPTRLTWFDEAGQHTESLESDRPVDEQLLLQFFRAVTSLVLNTAGLEDAYDALWIVNRAARELPLRPEDSTRVGARSAAHSWSERCRR